MRACQYKLLLLVLPLLVFFEPNSIAQLILPAETPRCVEPEFKDPDNMVLPKYPKDAIQARTDTVIELRAVVSEDGRTEELIGPSATNEFTRASLSAVRRWRFHPVLMESKPVKTVYEIHVHFNSTLLEVIPRLEVESPQATAPDLDKLDSSQGLVYRPDEPGVVAPKAVYAPGPEFTEKARRSKETGSVTVTLIVGADGVPRNIKTVCSSVPDLNQETIETISLWRFDPGTKDGHPVEVRMDISTAFQMY